jgi:hypothetical protein
MVRCAKDTGNVGAGELLLHTGHANLSGKVINLVHAFVIREPLNGEYCVAISRGRFAIPQQ